MFVVDTNVLVYAADTDSEFHGRCRELLEDWRRQTSAWYLTWSIVYEFLRVTTHARVFRTPWSAGDAWCVSDLEGADHVEGAWGDGSSPWAPCPWATVHPYANADNADDAEYAYPGGGISAFSAFPSG